jgi:Ni,Fe-hydrogenase I cytochrome b subunit
MSKNKKIVLGILTFLPIVLLVLYFIFFGFFFMEIFQSAQNNTEPNSQFMIGNFIVLFLLITVLVISALGMMIYYIIDISNNKTLDSNNRLIWILLLVFGGFIANAIYWYLYIWKETDTKSQIF